MQARFAVPLTGLIAGLLLSGCGGGDSSSVTTSASLSKSEFLARGNRICAAGDKEINAAGKKFFTAAKAPSPVTEQKFVTDVVVPNIQRQIDAINALPAPSGDEDQVGAIVDAAQSALDKVKQDPSLITRDGGSDPFAEADKLANDYGLTQCGSDNG